MSKAAGNAVNPLDDELGAANAAARLGADGGPISGRAGGNALRSPAPFANEDSWLDDELSDEELAALGEEDFGDEYFDTDALEEELGIDLDSDDFSMAPPAVASGRGEARQPISFEEEAPPPPRRAHSAPETSPMQSGAVVASRSSSVLTGDDSYGEALGDFDDNENDHRPVPRISIHAYCETPETMALLERAAVDRRLSKTHLTMHMGGLAKAIDHYGGSGTPNLIIIETIDGGVELLSRLNELAEVCDPSTKVIVIGRVNDIALYRELIRQGISDYVVRPQSPLQVIKAIATLYIDPSAPPIGRTIAFVGARGGVGSSTLAHNVAWCAAEEMNSDTVIVDLDLPFGTASLDFEQDPTSGLIEALTAPERLDDVLLDRLLQKHTDRLSLFTAPNLLDRDYDLDEQAFETVIDIVRASAPTIIVDVPHIWTGWSKRLLQTADEIIITATSDLASFRNTKNLVDIISGARPNDAAPKLVINQFDMKISSVQPQQYAEHVGLKPTAVFTWEPQLFHTAATNASPILEVGGKTKTAATLRELTQVILGKTMGASKKSRFDLLNLFSKRK